jgi:hypothetical protein
MLNRHAVDNKHGLTGGVLGGGHVQQENIHGGLHRSRHLDALVFSVGYPGCSVCRSIERSVVIAWLLLFCVLISERLYGEVW